MPHRDGSQTREELVSQQIKPVGGTADPRAMASGLPGLPERFIWRGEEIVVAEVLETWMETGPAREGGTARYLRKHWFRIKAASGAEMKVYFERQPRRGSPAKARWWLYSTCESSD